MKKAEWLEIMFVFVIITVAVGSATIMTIRSFIKTGLDAYLIISVLSIGSIILLVGLNKCVKNKKIIKELRKESRLAYWLGLTLISLMIVCISFIVVFMILKELGILI